jgi:hypothetical protein
MDVWIEDGAARIDAAFQDSATTPLSGQRRAIHEYRVRATASIPDLILNAVQATPHILPYRECPAAAANVDVMLGRPLATFRRDVLDSLKGTLGCTHLNDVLRSLADVPALVAARDRSE